MADIDARFPKKLKFLFKPKRYKVAHGGRGSGKSWGFARALLLIAASKPTRVNFNSLGRATGRADDGTLVNAGAPVSFNFSGPSGCGAEIRCLRVQVSEGGQIRVCDPAVANTADTRSCGT